MGKVKPISSEAFEHKDKEQPEKYEIESAADTLMRAEDIKQDKRLMPHVHKHLGKKMKSLKQLSQMAGQKKNEEDADEGNM
jgi:hypothetical protein